MEPAVSTALHDLTGAYAAGALTAPERVRAKAHLSNCARCALEARELFETAALLGVAAAAIPPAHLRARVLAEAASTAQLPALLGARSATAASGRLSRHARWPLRAAASLVALTFGIAAYTGLPGSDPQGVEQAQARGAVRTLTISTAAVSATVTVDPAAAGMTFVARGLPAPAPGRTYQLWLQDAAGPRPAGTFELLPSGEARAVIPSPRDADTLLVTEEPAGGSARPTTQPLLALDLRQA
jgi:hypothetical protein